MVSPSDIEEVLINAQHFVQLLSMDKWAEGIQFLESLKGRHWAYDCHYHTFLCLKAYAFDMDDFESALTHIMNGYKIVEDNRRKEWSLANLISSYDFDSFTDDEVFAEITYAIYSMMVAIVHIENKKNITGFVQAAFYIRRGWSSFQFCRRIMNERTKWESQNFKTNFEVGINLFFGITEMGFAIVPPPFSTILNFIGYSGDRDMAYKMLLKAWEPKKTAMKPIVALVLAGYISCGVHVLDQGEPDKKLLREIINWVRTEYPNNVYNDGIDCFEAMTEGNMDRIIDIVSKSNLQFQAKMAGFLFPALRVAAYALQEKWTEAEEHVRIFEDQVWSPATGTFLHACILQKVMEESEDEDDKLCLKAQISELLRKVQDRRRKIAGMGFHEEYILKYSKRFEKRPEDMVLPFYEAMCFFHFFPMVSLAETAIDGILLQVSRRWEKNEADLKNPEYHDIKSILLYIRSSCLKHVGKMNESLQALEEIVDLEGKITFANHIPPNAAYEIGRIYADHFGRYKTGRKWIKRSLKYSNYPNSFVTKYRAKMALKEMENQDAISRNQPDLLRSHSKKSSIVSSSSLEFIANRLA